MSEITLYANDGGLVTKLEMPPFIHPPDVVLWGQRTFIRDLEVSTNYVECFAWYAPANEA